MMSFPVSPCLAEPADTVRAAVGCFRGRRQNAEGNHRGHGPLYDEMRSFNPPVGAGHARDQCPRRIHANA